MKQLVGTHILLITFLSTTTICYSNQYWARTYGSNLTDHAFAIQQTSDDGYIVVGYTDSFGAGEFDIWVLKINSEGTVVWEKTYGRIHNDYARSIKQTTDGGYIVAGYTSTSIGSNFDLLVLKLDEAGEIVWEKTFGESESESSRDIQQTIDGGYIVATYRDRKAHV